MGTVALILGAVLLCFLAGLGVAAAYHLCFGVAEEDGE